MSRETKTTAINIPTLTVVKLAAIVIVLYLLYLVADVLIMLFAALIFSTAISPWVDWLEDRKIPRIFSVSLIYLLIISLLIGTIYLMIPPIVSQTAELANNWPMYLNKIRQWLAGLDNFTGGFPSLTAIEAALKNIATGLQMATGGLLSALSNLFGGLSALLIILVVAFYMATDRHSLSRLIGAVSPQRKQKRLITLSQEVQKKIGYWLSAQLFLCLIVFIFTYVSLSVMGVKYALVLAIIAGITEAIPYLGPLLAAIPGVFLAFIQSPILAIFVAIIYLLIQQVENNILVPMVMRKAVGLNPIISISVLMIGFKLGGVLGAILAIPAATAVNVVAQNWRLDRKKTK